MSAFAYETLGEHVVYPGHPLVFAYLALVRYGSIIKAMERPPGCHYPRCVADPDLPGAGDGAWGGHDLLMMLADGEPMDDVIAQADDQWRGVCGPGTAKHERHYEPGREQAARFRDRFIALASAIVAEGK